jgi:type IV pilus assembly protein PilA
LLVELTIVVVIPGVLAMMAAPRYQTVVEQSKASEAFVYLDQIAKDQEIYNARNSRYSNKLTRTGASSGFGRYTVIYNEKGFQPGRSSIP